MSRSADSFSEESAVSLAHVLAVRTAVFELIKLIAPSCIATESDVSLTDEFFSGELSSEKINFLVKNGFPEMLALFYFFEVNDCGKRQVVVTRDRVLCANIDWCLYSLIGQHDVRYHGEVMKRDLSKSFKITSRHLADFPLLVYSEAGQTGADCWPARPVQLRVKREWVQSHQTTACQTDLNHLHPDIKKIIDLDQNHFFMEKVYFVFLKLAALPSELFSTVLKKELPFEIFLCVYEKIIKRKAELAHALIHTKKFVDWYEKLTNSAIKSHVQFNLELFSLGLAEENMKACLACLSALIDQSVLEIPSTDHSAQAISFYTPCVALQSVLLDLCKVYSESEALPKEKIKWFALQLKNILRGVETLPFFGNAAQTELFNRFCDRLHKLTYQFERDFSLDQCHVSSFVCVSPGAMQSNVDKTSNLFFLWLDQQDATVPNYFPNIRVAKIIFSQTYRQWKSKREGLMEVTSTAIKSTQSFFSGFFSSQVLVPQSEINVFLDKINLVDDAHTFLNILAWSFSSKDMCLVSLVSEYIENLVKQCVTELSAKLIIEQMKTDFSVSEKFKKQLNFLIQEHEPLKIARSCIEAIKMNQLQCREVIDDWVEVNLNAEVKSDVASNGVTSALNQNALFASSCVAPDDALAELDVFVEGSDYDFSDIVSTDFHKIIVYEEKLYALDLNSGTMCEIDEAGEKNAEPLVIPASILDQLTQPSASH